MQTADKLHALGQLTDLTQLTNPLCVPKHKSLPASGEVPDLLEFLNGCFTAGWIRRASSASGGGGSRARTLEDMHQTVIRLMDDVMAKKRHSEVDAHQVDVDLVEEVNYYGQLMQQLYVEWTVIQPFLQRTHNLNFPVVYGSFLCAQSHTLDISSSMCQEFDRLHSTSDARIVKYMGVYEHLSGGPLLSSTIEPADVSSALLQTLAALASIQSETHPYQHNDLHIGNLWVEPHTHPLAIEYRLPLSRAMVNVKTEKRCLILDQKVASIGASSPSWYTQHLIERGYPAYAPGMDVFRLVGSLYAAVRQRNDKELIVFTRRVCAQLFGDKACEFVRQNRPSHIFAVRFLDYAKATMPTESFEAIYHNLFGMTYEKAFFQLFTYLPKVSGVRVDHIPNDLLALQLTPSKPSKPSTPLARMQTEEVGEKMEEEEKMHSINARKDTNSPDWKRDLSVSSLPIAKSPGQKATERMNWLLDANAPSETPSEKSVHSLPPIEPLSYPIPTSAPSKESTRMSRKREEKNEEKNDNVEEEDEWLMQRRHTLAFSEEKEERRDKKPVSFLQRLKSKMNGEEEDEDEELDGAAKHALWNEDESLEIAL